MNGLTDLYNAISVLHQIPVGGEDRLAAPAARRLTPCPAGTEPFDTVADGSAVVEHPEGRRGRLVRSGRGVTCRRWNWRQAGRTRLREDTTAALFIFDALAPTSDDALAAAADDLRAHVARLGSDVRTAQLRIVRADAARDGT